MKKRLAAMLLIITIILAGVSPVWAESSFEQIPEGCVALTMLHTNDTHGQYKNTSSTVGFEKVKTIADEENVDLILDAGDTFHGLPFATVEKGKSTADVLKAVGYDAIAPGNHDFNYGAENLKNLGSEQESNIKQEENTLIEEAEITKGFKILNSNVMSTSDGSHFFQPYMTKEVVRGKGEDAVKIKVGILGLINPEIYSQTAPDNVKNLQFINAVDATKKTVSILKQEKCDVIIALSHIGMTEKQGGLSSREIAEKVPEINVIVDGHTHAKYDTMVGNTLVAQTGYGFGNVGLIKVFYNPDTKKIAGSVGKMITAQEAANYESDWLVSETISKIEKRQKTILEEPVGSTDTLLDGSIIKTYTGETNLGRVITAAYLEETGADIAFENCGGIRASVLAGSINRGQIIAVSPFGNYLVTKKISGADVRSILEKSIEMGNNNLKAYGEGKQEWPSNGGGSYLQVGGLKITYSPDKEYGNRLVSVDIGGAPLDQDTAYTIVTNQYVAANSKYPELSEKPALNNYGATEEVLTTYIKKHSGNPEWASLMQEENLKPIKIDPVPETPKTPEISQDPEMSDPEEIEEMKRQEAANEEAVRPSDKVATGIFANPAGSAIFAAAALAALLLATMAFKYESDYKEK